MPQKANRKKPKQKISIDNKLESDQKKIEKSIQEFPKEAVEQITRKVTKEICVRGEFSSGPIPSPQILEGYEKICPGFADRIIKMAEKESQHRHDMEEKALIAEIEFNQRSLTFDSRETTLG